MAGMPIKPGQDFKHVMTHKFPGPSFWLLTAAACLLLLGKGAAQAVPADPFRQFVENPPVIEEVVFAYVEPRSSSDGPRPTNFFLGKYQTNAYFGRTAATVDELYAENWKMTDQADIFAKFDDRYWRFMGGPQHLKKWTDTGKPEEEQNQVKTAHDNGLYRLKLALNMGIPYAQIGSIRWNGDTFDYRDQIRTKLRTEVRLHGRLSRDDQGRPERLNLHVGMERLPPRTVEADWVVQYGYPTNFPGLEYLPTAMKIFAVRTGLLSSVADISILSLTVSPRLLPESAFNLEGLGNSDKTLLLVSNQALVYKSLNGWAEVKPPNPKDRIVRPKPRSYLRLVGYASAVLLGALAVTIWAVRRKKKTDVI